MRTLKKFEHFEHLEHDPKQGKVVPQQKDLSGRLGTTISAFLTKLFAPMNRACL
jgi:hypothetical protein